MSSMKRRRREEEIQSADPIDEQEQEMIIHVFETQCFKDAQNTSKLLSYICSAFVVISLGTFPFLHDYSTKIYSINAAAVHLVAGSIAKRIACVGRDDYESDGIRTNTLGYLGFGMALCPFLLQRFSRISNADEWIIYLLAASNILILVTVSYMKKETRNSFLQLNQLKCFKYKHKSL